MAFVKLIDISAAAAANATVGVRSCGLRVDERDRRQFDVSGAAEQPSARNTQPTPERPADAVAPNSH
ncbi:MAG: hypothetical protein C0482_11170 [Gordonia sp.]|nr:hypothetical protein [Gordonia sp. (in: high G+C Gram-positive bacteria)]OZG29883.1 hypothetical protein BH683_006885 [Williamsia sp. 1138]